MSIYDGEVIFSCRDESGVIDVVEEAKTRSLHFGTVARQTTMFRSEPQTLALSYTRCMMTGLLFVEPVRSALILGLGGGALARFLLHYFPECRIDAVEKRMRVVEVARAFFELPVEERLKISVGRAEDFLRRCKEGAYDLVLVDIHDSDGMALGQAEIGFFARCRRLMSDRGLLVINLWSGEKRQVLRRVSGELQRCFAAQVMELPVAGKSNKVALAFSFPIPKKVLSQVRERAEELEGRTGVELEQLLEDLIWHNRRWT
ncbi:MAG: spermine synthase, partial [Gemmatimonadetes bacterium]|jgi:spermidine synthase|nr:spermine synthase [Gemmatimonadota bacterium]